ncbi:MAG TPA: pyridoxamine 5'-phosphate oxidase family protein [Candidatus Cloacimonadota bacterium]|nr:pyridoxamine 5'-phosphate oxidase family protein [Candidatus Cloacimonadota bacterium]
MAKVNESALQSEVMSYFGRYQYAYLSTCDKNQPRVRPVALFYVEDRFWVVTFSGDAKVSQIRSNRNIEICLPIREAGDTGYIRATGTAHIDNDSYNKREASEFCYFFEEYFSGVDDPDFTLLALQLDEFEYMRPGESFSQKFTLRKY